MNPVEMLNKAVKNHHGDLDDLEEYIGSTTMENFNPTVVYSSLSAIKKNMEQNYVNHLDDQVYLRCDAGPILDDIKSYVNEFGVFEQYDIFLVYKPNHNNRMEIHITDQDNVNYQCIHIKLDDDLYIPRHHEIRTPNFYFKSISLFPEIIPTSDDGFTIGREVLCIVYAYVAQNLRSGTILHRGLKTAVDQTHEKWMSYKTILQPIYDRIEIVKSQTRHKELEANKKAVNQYLDQFVVMKYENHIEVLKTLKRYEDPNGDYISTKEGTIPVEDVLKHCWTPGYKFIDWLIKPSEEKKFYKSKVSDFLIISYDLDMGTIVLETDPHSNPNSTSSHGQFELSFILKQIYKQTGDYGY